MNHLSGFIKIILRWRDCLEVGVGVIKADVESVQFILQPHCRRFSDPVKVVALGSVHDFISSAV